MIRQLKKFIVWFRDSMTGRFVSGKYAKKHGDTTTREQRIR